MVGNGEEHPEHVKEALGNLDGEAWRMALIAELSEISYSGSVSTKG